MFDYICLLWYKEMVAVHLKCMAKIDLAAQ